MNVVKLYDALFAGEKQGINTIICKLRSYHQSFNKAEAAAESTSFSASDYFDYPEDESYPLIAEISDQLANYFHQYPETSDEKLAHRASELFKDKFNLRQSHSALYQDLTNADTFKRNAFKDFLELGPLPDADAADGNSVYDLLCDLLRENSDAQFGIVSKLDDGQWVRDARFSVPLNERISHDSMVIETNNMLLRCLSRLRAIDYAIAKKYPDGSSDTIRVDLKKQIKAYIDFVQENLASENLTLEYLKTIEQAFDSVLIEKLHEANLTKECYSSDDAAKLLFHYRNLSSLLILARPMVTLTYDRKARVFQRETQYPVTIKSNTQKSAMSRLSQIHPFAQGDDKNHQTVKSVAVQEANCLFADLMKDDRRSLPAQARKTHLVGAKNAFIVKNELFFNHEPGDLGAEETRPDETATLWLARTGTPVYIGKGEHSDSVQTHTLENLAQINNTARNLMSNEEETLDMHLNVLNTDTPLQHQHTMIRHLKKAAETQSYGYSYMPTNADGLFRLLQVSPSLVYENHEHRPRGLAPFDKSSRINSVAEVTIHASKVENMLSVVTCASGQDRTGTAVEKATQYWMKKEYQDRDCDVSNIQDMRAEGANAAEITSHHVYGSPGMKEDSQAGDTFNELATAQFYRTSAGTNKKNPVGHVGFLDKPSNKAIEEYRNNLDRFEDAIRAYKDDIDNDKAKKALYHKAQAVLATAKKIVGKRATNTEIKAKLNAEKLDVISLSLVFCTQALEHPEDAGNLRKITSISEHLNASSSRATKGLGIALMAVAFASLVVVGILAAIPSGGHSLLLTLVGATGLSVMAATGIGGAAVASAGISGASLYKVTTQRGLSRSLSFFTSAFSKAEPEPEQEPDDVSEDASDLMMNN